MNISLPGDTVPMSERAGWTDEQWLENEEQAMAYAERVSSGSQDPKEVRRTREIEVSINGLGVFAVLIALVFAFGLMLQWLN